MTLTLVLWIILTIALLAFIGYAISTLVQLKKTLINVDKLVVDMDSQLPPLLDDLHSVVKKANREMERIDDVIGNVKDISHKVSATTRVVNEIVSSPLIKAASISAGARGAIKKLVGR